MADRAGTKSKAVLVMVPTYNEVKNIRPLMEAIYAVAKQQPGYSFDVAFADDTSPDGTAQEIRRLQRDNSHIYLLSGIRAGLGRAYVRALRAALELGDYFAIITMDADLSHDPAYIPALLSALEEGADFVIGSRYVSGGGTARGYSLYRRIESLLANSLARHLIDLRLPVRDLTSGFRALRRTSLATIPLESITASGYVFQVQLLYGFAKQQYRIREVPIVFRARRHGTSKLGIYDITEFVQQAYALNPSSRLRRLLRFCTVGVLGSIINVAVLVMLVELVQLRVSAAYLVALECSIVSNFFLNQYFTFKPVSIPAVSRLARLGRLFVYNVISVAGAAIAWVVFSLLLGLASNYIVADIAGIAVATGWNYWLSCRFVWPLIDKPPIDKAKSLHELQEA